MATAFETVTTPAVLPPSVDKVAGAKAAAAASFTVIVMTSVEAVLSVAKLASEPAASVAVTTLSVEPATAFKSANVGVPLIVKLEGPTTGGSATGATTTGGTTTGGTTTGGTTTGGTTTGGTTTGGVTTTGTPGAISAATAAVTAVVRAVPVKPLTAVVKLPAVTPETSAVVAEPCDTTAAFPSASMVLASAAEVLLAVVMEAIWLDNSVIPVTPAEVADVCTID
jgi:hypothetical protein